jgi:hypothetical protein
VELQHDNLQRILQDIYHHHPDNALLLTLLRFLADEIRTAHEQQFSLPALTNRNILIGYDADYHWQELNLEKIALAEPLGLTARAMEIGYINLPDDYWRIFKHMYWCDKVIPAEFNQTADAIRKKNRQDMPAQSMSEQDIWLWDEKSAQAMVILNRDSKKKYRSISQTLKQLLRTLGNLPRVYLTYRKLKQQAYSTPIEFTDKIGVALHRPYAKQELALLSQLANIPVLLRFYAHETEQEWLETIDLIKQCRSRQHKVAVALVQNRQVVLQPQQWQHFLSQIIPAIHEDVLWIEVAHAINRVKWGIWYTDEYLQLLSITAQFQQQFPQLRLTGPAVIDFEWHRTLDALRAIPKAIHLFALSQHLYVDRRGAPENYQGKFSTLEKCALLKAIAQTSKRCANRVIISEVNWPLQDTGVWSPIGSPYTAPEWFVERPGVSEEAYANYLIRFLLISLTSGYIDQVFWWRLSAHGFGLVDDQQNFRLRPAFFTLQFLLQQLNDAMFTKRLPSEKHVYLLHFQKKNQEFIIAWSTKVSIISAPWESYQLYERDGQKADPNLSANEVISVGEKPIYIQHLLNI